MSEPLQFACKFKSLGAGLVGELGFDNKMFVLTNAQFEPRRASVLSMLLRLMKHFLDFSGQCFICTVHSSSFWELIGRNIDPRDIFEALPTLRVDDISLGQRRNSKWIDHVNHKI